MTRAAAKRHAAVMAVGTLLGVLGLTQAWRVGTDHLGSGWPDHAKWHALLGGLFLALLSVVLLVTLWGPFRRGVKGVEDALALLIAGPAVTVAAAMWLLPSGAPGGGDTVLTAVATAVGLVTAILVWRARG